MAVRSIAVGACKGFTQNQHPSREAKKLSNFSLFLGCALPCYRNCFPCYFLSVSGQEIPKNRLRSGTTHDFPSRNRDFPVFFPVLDRDRVSPGLSVSIPSRSIHLRAPDSLTPKPTRGMGHLVFGVASPFPDLAGSAEYIPYTGELIPCSAL